MCWCYRSTGSTTLQRVYITFHIVPHLAIEYFRFKCNFSFGGGGGLVSLFRTFGDICPVFRLLTMDSSDSSLVRHLLTSLAATRCQSRGSLSRGGLCPRGSLSKGISVQERGLCSGGKSLRAFSVFFPSSHSCT